MMVHPNERYTIIEKNNFVKLPDITHYSYFEEE